MNRIAALAYPERTNPRATPTHAKPNLSHKSKRVEGVVSACATVPHSLVAALTRLGEFAQSQILVAFWGCRDVTVIDGGAFSGDRPSNTRSSLVF